MTYSEAVQFLFDRLPMFQRVGAQAYKKDLTNTIKLCKALGDPQDSFPTVHIAGTNGKGSVSSMTSSVLQEAGYKVGLYTSPHLKSFTERIRVNGEEIPEEAVVFFVENTQNLLLEVEPSFFEATVAMAFWWFRECKVDIAVIEVGMGGRLDSTNIILPVAGAVTNISMDHAQHLGDTLPLIAAEKAGIFKQGIPFVVGQKHPETQAVFERIASERGASLVFAEDFYQCTAVERNLTSQSFKVDFHGKTVWQSLTCDLPGIYQAENVATALTLFDLLRIQGWKILPEHVSEGIGNVRRNTGLAGRMTLLGENPVILADVGHNEAGLKLTMAQIRSVPHKHLHMVLGAVNDKDIAKMLALLPKEATYYFVRPDVPRGLDESVLQEQAKQAGLIGDCFGTVAGGVAAAKSNAGPEDLIYVGGSTFVVAEVI